MNIYWNQIEKNICSYTEKNGQNFYDRMSIVIRAFSPPFIYWAYLVFRVYKYWDQAIIRGLINVALHLTSQQVLAKCKNGNSVALGSPTS